MQPTDLLSALGSAATTAAQVYNAATNKKTVAATPNAPVAAAPNPATVPWYQTKTLYLVIGGGVAVVVAILFFIKRK